MTANPLAPLTVYGCTISYFTGKFETYLRYKGIPYESRMLDLYHYLWRVPRELGITQYPSVKLADGRWMTDTTPMIAWLETQYPEPAIYPEDPVMRFIALLIEDYADEWMWRPAMHYRWNNQADARLASTSLAEEVVRLPLPLEARRRWVGWRQKRLFVDGDGVDAGTRPHMDGAYLRLLDALEPVLDARPFVFGERPTIADIGLMGPLWRHFTNDPTPEAIMRERAPSVRAWTTRTWNADAGELGGREVLSAVPGDLEPLLEELTATLLPMLVANAKAHTDGAATHDFTVQGVTYRSVPTGAYRVWVLERLRERHAALDAQTRDAIARLLGADAIKALEPAATESGHDPGGTAPFCHGSRAVRDGGRRIWQPVGNG